MGWVFGERRGLSLAAEDWEQYTPSVLTHPKDRLRSRYAGGLAGQTSVLMCKDQGPAVCDVYAKHQWRLSLYKDLSAIAAPQRAGESLKLGMSLARSGSGEPRLLGQLTAKCMGLDLLHARSGECNYQV